MKIAFFNGFHLPHTGGVENYTENLARELKNLDHEIVIITTNHANLAPREVTKNYQIFRLPTRKIFKNRFPFPRKDHEFREIIDEIKQQDLDLFICNTRYFFTTPLGLNLAKLAQKPAIVIDHSSDFVSVSNKFLDFFGHIYEKYLTSKIKKFSPEFYGVSAKTNEWLARKFHITARGILYNSIDAREFEKYKNDTFCEIDSREINIVYIGRILREKGVENLLTAFSGLAKKYQNVELFIGGDGPLLAEVRANFRDPRIHFLGKLPHDEVMALNNSAQIFAHPSMYPEGLPTAILEAGLMKCAVVATDRGGTCEVINSDKVGLICAENSDDLRKKLEFLIEHPREIAKMGENLHNRIARNFAWSVTARKLDDIIKGENA